VTHESFTSRRGLQFLIRDMRPEDTDLLVDLFYHLSPDTIYKRFHAVLNDLPEERVRQEAARLARIDPQHAAALIALHDEHAVGVARFYRLPGTVDAESAVVVRDDYQQNGLGTFLLELLRDKALAMGIEHLIAMVQAQNNPILKVIRRSGLKSHWRFEQGETYLVVDTRM